MITPIEDILMAAEKFEETQEAKRKEELYKSRYEIAFPVMGDSVKNLPLAELDELVFTNMVEGAKVANEKKKQAEIDKKKEDDRIKEENAKLKAANDKLESEKKKLKDEEDKRIADDAEQKKKEQAAKRKLQRGPDKAKLENLLKELTEFKSKVPSCKDEDAIDIATNVTGLLEKVEVYLNKQIEKL